MSTSSRIRFHIEGKTMAMIYLVVKEEGVYSDWSKENICYFTTREEAEDYVVCMERLVTDTHRSEVSYDVEEISQMVLPSEEEQEKLIAQAAHSRELEKKRRELETKKREAEAEILLKGQRELLRVRVQKFLDLWYANPDAVSPDVLQQARKDVKDYVYFACDPRATQWLYEHK